MTDRRLDTIGCIVEGNVDGWLLYRQLDGCFLAYIDSWLKNWLVEGKVDRCLAKNWLVEGKVDRWLLTVFAVRWSIPLVDNGYNWLLLVAEGI